MHKKEIQNIQDRILDLAPNRSGVYLKYCCSELSRLIISWLATDKSRRLYILKAANVMGSDMSHDILAIKQNDNITIIDPTIWQFFPKAKTILVYEGTNLNSAQDALNEKYRCEWAIGSQEKIPSSKEQAEYLKITNSIINANLKETIL